jgi:hypothetical protein
MTKAETPDETAIRLLESDDRRLRTGVLLASLSVTYNGDREYADTEKYFEELLTAYKDEVQVRQQLEGEARTGLYLSGARAIMNESRHENYFGLRQKEWRFTRRELEKN